MKRVEEGDVKIAVPMVLADVKLSINVEIPDKLTDVIVDNRPEDTLGDIDILVKDNVTFCDRVLSDCLSGNRQGEERG